MIKISKLNKSYDHRGIAGIHDFNLEIKKGTIFSMLGPNGSGKTTLLNLISGQIRPDSGEVKVSGQIQFFETKSPTQEMNVQKFLMESVKDSSIPQEKRLQLARDFADIFEFTYQLRQTIGQLSQGQLQKVLMSAELINSSEILFLDEPFVHLDPMTRKTILEDLFQYLRQKEMTVIWITHDIHEALKYSDQIGVIQHGKLEQTGTPLSLLERPKNLYVAQFFGQQNFIKVSRDVDTWATPWGPWNFLLSDQEGYLVVPQDAWTLATDSTFQGTLIQLSPRLFGVELLIDVENKQFTLWLPLHFHNQLKVGQKLGIKADLSRCLLIPL